METSPKGLEISESCMQRRIVGTCAGCQMNGVECWIYANGEDVDDTGPRCSKTLVYQARITGGYGAYVCSPCLLRFNAIGRFKESYAFLCLWVAARKDRDGCPLARISKDVAKRIAEYLAWKTWRWTVHNEDAPTLRNVYL